MPSVTALTKNADTIAPRSPLGLFPVTPPQRETPPDIHHSLASLLMNSVNEVTR